MEYVTLVDRNGNPMGAEEKIKAHRGGGMLHLAFSLFVFNAQGELLLQKRADGKYHFAGLWSNSCCGHPQPGEAVKDAARRRLREELGFDAEVSYRRTIEYKAYDEVSDLTEKELLHVFVGRYDASPLPAPEEVGDWRWQSLATLGRELAMHPERFTPWFRMLMEKMEPG